jgi:hypothetical protein
VNETGAFKTICFEEDIPQFFSSVVFGPNGQRSRLAQSEPCDIARHSGAQCRIGFQPVLNHSIEQRFCWLIFGKLAFGANGYFGLKARKA